MSEIEKLYKNAGINLGCCKYAKYDYEGEEGTWYYCTKEGKECWTYPNGDADCVEKGYPPFTAEKQLKLIKWLIIEGYIEDMLTVQISEENFEACLADTFNELWQDLTEEEKQQVKGFLE